MTTLLRWSGDGLSGNLTTSSAGPGDTAPSFITGATPTIEPSGDRPPAIRFAQSGTTVNYAVWTFSAVDLYAYTIRAYVNFTAFPASDQAAVWKFVNAGETLASWAFAITSSGFLRVMDKNGSTAATGTVALTAGTWYRVEGVVNGESTHLYAYEGESTVQHDHITATLPAPVAGGRVRIGNDFGTPNLPPFWFDDLRVDNVPELIGSAAASTIYASLVELRARFGISTSTASDDELTAALHSASRSIDKTCGRRFYLDDAVSARTYFADSSCRAAVDDFATATGLIVRTDDGTYETTWTSAEYRLEPMNGVVDGETGWPYNEIRALRSRLFPTATYGPSLQVTAQWGWPAVPKGIREATLIIASELFKLKEAPFGVAAYGDFGPIRVKDNPVAMRHVAPYVRHPVMVA